MVAFQVSSAYMLTTEHLQEHIPSGTPQGSLAFHPSIFPYPLKATLQPESPLESMNPRGVNHSSPKWGGGPPRYNHTLHAHI